MRSRHRGLAFRVWLAAIFALLMAVLTQASLASAATGLVPMTDSTSSSPETTLSAFPVPNAAGWNNTAVTVTLSATDEASPIDQTYFTVDSAQLTSGVCIVCHPTFQYDNAMGPACLSCHNGYYMPSHGTNWPVTAYTGALTVGGEGATSLGYWSVDASGNVEPTNTATIRIDKTAPSLSLDATSTYAGSATIDATATDTLSGLDHVDMRLDGGSWVTETQLSTSALGSHTVYARAFDFVGNQSTASAAFTVMAPPPVPITLSTITKLAGPSSVKVGKTLRLTGTISYFAAPGHVTVVRTRLVGKQWERVGTAIVSVAGGAFSYSFKPGYSGIWTFVATYSGGVVGTTTYTGSKSGVKSVRVN